MRILDRYAISQLIPVWLWCLSVFLFLSCLIDLFEHLDEILRYRIPLETVAQYYLNFMPLVFVRASPLALLLASAFVASRLSRHQELLAMNASGTSLLRASVPFLFVGWLASLSVFAVNDLVVPKTSPIYEQLKLDVFRGQGPDDEIEGVAIMDPFNRIYHARLLDLQGQELTDLTVLEHDRNNKPTKSLYASRAMWTKHGWLLLHGVVYRAGPGGKLRGEPESFVERLLAYPVTPFSFVEPQRRPDLMRYAQLRLFFIRLKASGADVKRYAVELGSKITLPLMNMVVCLIAFAGSTQLTLRGNLKGLGISLVWGVAYYLLVGLWEGLGKSGVVPVMIAIWAPHVLAVGWCVRVLRRTL
jgi:lipopolysaccharide export system permease protein